MTELQTWPDGHAASLQERFRSISQGSQTLVQPPRIAKSTMYGENRYLKGQVEQLVARLFSYSDSRYTPADLEHPNVEPQWGPQAVDRNGQSSC